MREVSMKKEKFNNNGIRLEKIELMLEEQKNDINFLMSGLEDLKLRKENLLSQLSELEKIKKKVDNLKTQLEEEIKTTLEKTQEFNKYIEENYKKEIELKLKKGEMEINKMKSRKIIFPFIGSLGLIIISILIYIIILWMIK